MTAWWSWRSTKLGARVFLWPDEDPRPGCSSGRKAVLSCPRRPSRDLKDENETDAATVDGDVMSAADATSETTQQPPAESGGPRKVGGNRFFNWLFARTELARAREAVGHLTAEQREYVRRGKVAFELGELALAPGNAVRSGSTAPHAANLFRQALYWALLAHAPQHAHQAPEAVWAAVDAELLKPLALKDDEFARLTVAMRSTFVELADGTPADQRATAELLRRTANRLVTNSQRVLWALDWAKTKRLLRLFAFATACLIPVALTIALWPPKPDLAKGKPWHTSSIGIECHPEKSECGGVTTDILFHTKLEPNPWFEYDFGAPIAFSSLTIRNRSDYGPERAVPLVVEVSNDDKKFQEIARRNDSFSTWKPSFPTQHARYLRLRVARESMLHLEAIQVHP